MTIDMQQHEAAVDAVLAKLKTFLMKPDHGDGSWPDIPQEDLNLAAHPVGKALGLKWGRAVDDVAPVGVRMWHRGKLRMICDWAYVENGARDDEETDDAREARFLRNLSTVSGASAACAEELPRLHIEMADVHS